MNPQAQVPQSAPTLQARPPPAPPINEPLAQSVLLELRSAIRGRTHAELTVTGAGDAPGIDAALTVLIARGQVVRRGSKFFVA